MYIVRLDPNLLEVNARVAASATMRAGSLAASIADIGGDAGVPSTSLSGTIHNGQNAVTAQVVPGTTGRVRVSFDLVVLSVSSATFDLYRTEVKALLGAGAEQRIADTVGIGSLPPPVPASRMASYVLQLFSSVLFDGETVSDQSRAFSEQNCAAGDCVRMLQATRRLEVTQVKFSGTLTASSDSPATERVAAYVPITAIEFGDGLTIPFAGYSDNVAVDCRGLTPLAIPRRFWSELAGDADSGSATEPLPQPGGDFRT